MSDYMTATLVLPTFALDLVAIQEALDREGLPNEESRASDGTATLIWAEAAYGEVPGVENALATLGIAFDRHSDAKYDYNAESRLFRPDTESVCDATIYTLGDHQPVIPLANLEQLAKAGPLTIEAIRSYLGLPAQTVADWAARNEGMAHHDSDSE
jgi:hypothetical protein